MFWERKIQQSGHTHWELGEDKESTIWKLYHALINILFELVSSVIMFQFIKIQSHSDRETGDKHSCGHLKGTETSSGKLCHGGPWNPIQVDLLANFDKRYATSVCWSGKSSVGILFTSYFLRNTPKPPCDIRSREIYKLAMYNLWADWCIHVQEEVFNCW